MTDLIEVKTADLNGAKRVYISGPMSGLPELNYPAFHSVAAQLRNEGFEVENPAENPEPPCGSWNGYMRLALIQIAKCGAVHVLPGWTKSRGARLEVHIAQELGLMITRAEGAEELMP